MGDDAAPLVLSHWYHLFEDLEASPMEFYASVEESVERREIPDAERSRVDHHEGGVLSAKREYLRVSRGRLAFDVCAAPFGRLLPTTMPSSAAWLNSGAGQSCSLDNKRDVIPRQKFSGISACHGRKGIAKHFDWCTWRHGSGCH